MTKFGAGVSARRVEDSALLRGAGVYIDDLAPAGAARLVLLRSPHAHARVAAVATDAARALPGVLGIWTIADLDAEGLGDLLSPVPLKNRDGSGRTEPPRPLLARERVRHVGEAVALIAAETLAAAQDAADAVMVDYAAEPAAADPHAALAEDAPRLHDTGNLCFDWAEGDAAAVEAAFARADRIIRLTLINNRLVAAPMEPRGCVAAYDAETGRFTLTTNSQGGYVLRGALGSVFRLDEDRFRIVTPEVGGGFGSKIFPYPEQALACFAARRLGRPVKWVCARDEAFLSDAQGRAQVSDAALALDSDGRALALDVDTIADLGAYVSHYAPFIATGAGVIMLPGVYSLPAVHVRVRGVMTNTVPVDAYRGAGRPEAIYVIERLMDQAGVETGLGPVEIRRRNMIRHFPAITAMGETYDSGDFIGAMESALVKADAAGFPARRAESAARGLRRGFGLACYIEACAGGAPESARLIVTPDDGLRLHIGTQDNGQGHRTTYAQMAAERLDLPADRIRVVQGDTDLIPTGGGTGGSRSLVTGGSATIAAVDALIETAHARAAEWLEADPRDLGYEAGAFRILGADRVVTLAQLAADAPLEAEGRFRPPAKTYPNGCHICEVEIDPETGALTVLGYTAIDDFGTVINPLLTAGQVHGGVVQGLGQALSERVVFDGDGQLLTGSFMDYALPHAGDIPLIALAFAPTACTTNPLGAKGCGEAGAIAAPPAAIHAALDALRPLGVRDLAMPLTPQSIYIALAKTGGVP